MFEVHALQGGPTNRVQAFQDRRFELALRDLIESDIIYKFQEFALEEQVIDYPHA